MHTALLKSSSSICSLHSSKLILQQNLPSMVCRKPNYAYRQKLILAVEGPTNNLGFPLTAQVILLSWR